MSYSFIDAMHLLQSPNILMLYLHLTPGLLEMQHQGSIIVDALQMCVLKIKPAALKADSALLAEMPGWMR